MFGFPNLFCNIHVAGVSTEPEGAYSSGAPASLLYRKFTCLLNFGKLGVGGCTVTEYRFGIIVL